MNPAISESIGRPAAYVSFSTFLSAIQYLTKDDLPANLTASSWPFLSTTSSSQMLSAFRFLGLVDEGGRTLSPISDLVAGGKLSKDLLKSVLHQSYPTIDLGGLASSTSADVVKSLSEYGVKGATLKRAVSFLLKAAEFVEVPLSLELSRVIRNSSARRRGRPNTSKRSSLPVGQERQGADPSMYPSRTIRLQDGGELTLTLRGNPFNLGERDWNLVNELIQRLRDYEQPT